MPVFFSFLPSVWVQHVCELQKGQIKMKLYVNWPSAGLLSTALHEKLISVQRALFCLGGSCLQFFFLFVSFFFYLYLSLSLTLTLLLPLAFWHFAKAETPASPASIGCQWHHRRFNSENYFTGLYCLLVLNRGNAYNSVNGYVQNNLSG